MNITANGRYLVTERATVGRAALYASGTFGGATITFEHKDAADNFAALENGSYTDEFQDIINIGINQNLYVNVTGGTGIDIHLDMGAVP